jgi:hypothetical protein
MLSRVLPTMGANPVEVISRERRMRVMACAGPGILIITDLCSLVMSGRK